MLEKCSSAHLHLLRSLLHFGAVSTFALAVIAYQTQAVAQSPASGSSSSAEPYAVRKAVANEAVRPTGVTFVALNPGLENVFAGKEPSSLEELRALELQQSQVAKAIEAVTVNIQQGTAQGSGVIITADGYVLTAAHVAGAPNRNATLVLNDGTRVRAKSLGMNRNMDAGLMKIIETRRTPWPHATLGRSSELKVGQWVIGSGHPGGWKPERGTVVRVGRVLSIGKSRSDNEAHTLFSDVALIGGDSGGPLFTLEGKLIGIHSRIGTEISDNMHVPIDVFASSWDRMVRSEVWGVLPGYQPMIGVIGPKEGDAPTISSVIPDSPASQAGLQAGDEILTVDGQTLQTFSDLRAIVQASTPGDVLLLTLKREEQIIRLPITIGVAE